MAKKPKIAAPKKKGPKIAAPVALRLVEMPVKDTPYAFLIPAPGVPSSDLTMDERQAIAVRAVSLEGKIPRYRPQSSLPKEFADKMNAVGEGALAVARKHGIPEKLAAEARKDSATAPAVRSPAASPNKAPKQGTKRGRAAEFIAALAPEMTLPGKIEKAAKELATLVEVPFSTALRWLKNGNTN